MRGAGDGLKHGPACDAFRPPNRASRVPPPNEKPSLKRFDLVWAYHNYMAHTGLEVLKLAEPTKPIVIVSWRRRSRSGGLPGRTSGEKV